jgi:hypothetical protein
MVTRNDSRMLKVIGLRIFTKFFGAIELSLIVLWEKTAFEMVYGTYVVIPVKIRELSWRVMFPSQEND